MQNCFLTGEKSPKFCVLNWEMVPKCSCGLVQGSGQSPELLVLVFHFLVVLTKWSLKWAWSLVQVQGRARSSWFLFSPFCLSLGKGGSCHALFSKLSAHQESAGISGAGAELCSEVPAIRLWLFTVSGIENTWSSQILGDKSEWLWAVLGAEVFQLGVLILSPAVPTSTTSCDTDNCEIEPICAT